MSSFHYTKYAHYKKRPKNYTRHFKKGPGGGNLAEAIKIAQDNPGLALWMFRKKEETK